MKKAVIYTRVSSDEQVKGNSLTEQETKCRYFIKAKDMKKGNWKGGIPYGYNIKDKKLVINKK